MTSQFSSLLEEITHDIVMRSKPKIVHDEIVYDFVMNTKSCCLNTSIWCSRLLKTRKMSKLVEHVLFCL